jgi:hypothetical protein
MFAAELAITEPDPPTGDEGARPSVTSPRAQTGTT